MSVLRAICSQFFAQSTGYQCHIKTLINYYKATNNAGYYEILSPEMETLLKPYLSRNDKALQDGLEHIDVQENLMEESSTGLHKCYSMPNYRQSSHFW